MPPGFARHGIRVLSGRRVELLHDISEGNPAVRQGSSMLGHCQLDFADTLTGIAAAAEVALEEWWGASTALVSAEGSARPSGQARATDGDLGVC